jgi:hypothetical protein
VQDRPGSPLVNNSSTMTILIELVSRHLVSPATNAVRRFGHVYPTFLDLPASLWTGDIRTGLPERVDGTTQKCSRINVIDLQLFLSASWRDLCALYLRTRHTLYMPPELLSSSSVHLVPLAPLFLSNGCISTRGYHSLTCNY